MTWAFGSAPFGLRTAQRVKSGEAISVPNWPDYDSRGMRMEMVA